MQDCIISIANALEILQSCTKPSKYAPILSNISAGGLGSFRHSDDQFGVHEYAGLILRLRPTNKRRRYKVTPSLIGWAKT